MYYFCYKDDGPKGVCVQEASITSPWLKLFKFKNFDLAKDKADKLLESKHRRNPEIIGWFSDSEYDGLNPVIFYNTALDQVGRTPKELDNLIESVKKSGIVCDSINRCEGWEKSYKRLKDSIAFYDKAFGGPYTGLSFKFCPWCGEKTSQLNMVI